MLKTINKNTLILLLVFFAFLMQAASVPAEPPSKENQQKDYEVNEMGDRGRSGPPSPMPMQAMSVQSTQGQQPDSPPGLEDKLTGLKNGRSAKESLYSDNSVLSAYGTEFQMVGRGTTKSMQEAKYRFRDKNSKSLIAVDDDIESIEFYMYKNSSIKKNNQSQQRTQFKEKEYLDYSEKTRLQGSLIGEDGRVSPLLESYLNTVSGKNEEDVGEFLNLNGLVIPENGVNIYQIKHDPNDWVYSEIRSKNNFSFIAMDPAGAQATYDGGFTAPYCSTSTSPCTANSTLLLSRDGMGPGEPNAPNTIDSASDGTSTTNGYEQEESVENISVRSVNHDAIGSGDQVEVTTWFYCYDTSDVINVAHTSSTSSISWNVENSGACTGSPGPFSRTVTFNLANNGNDQAIRVINEWNGDAGTIESTSGYGDQDDLVFNVDGQKPSLSLYSPTNESVFNSGNLVKFNTSDTESGVKTVKYSLDGGTSQTLAAPYEIDTSSWSEGLHTLEIRSNDSAGNQRVKTYEFTIDDTDPFVNLISPVNKLYDTKTINLEYTSSDANLQETFYSLNGEPNQTLSGNTAFTAEEGVNSLNLYARDQAGNINRSSANFEVDTLPPEIILDSPVNASEVEKGLYVNLSVNDANLENVSYSHNGGPNTSSFDGSFDIPTNKWPDTRFSGQRMIYVDPSTGEPRVLYPDGTQKSLGVNPSITGEMGDLDSDPEPELPFIDSSGNLKIIDVSGDVQTLASGLSNSKEVIGTGDWKGTFEYVFYSDPNDNSYIKRVRAGSAPERVLSGVAANSVLGPANFSADGNQELVFLGTSSVIKYIDDGTVKTTGFSSFGSNNQLGIGSPSDFDEDGKARVPFVDGSNNIGLLNSAGSTQILDSNYGNAVKTVPAATDWAGDSREEIIHISKDSQRIYQMFLNGTSKRVLDSSNNPVTGVKTIGIQEGPDKRVNNLRVYANDSNRWNSSKYYEFNITTNNPPVVILDNPGNNSIIQGDSILNFTISDSSLDSVKYSLDGAANSTEFIGSNDVNLSLSSEGEFTFDIYAEDTDGAITKRNYVFESDNTQPNLQVSSPKNKTYNTTSVDLNYTASDKNLDSVYYNLNQGSNTTLTGNKTISVPEGTNTLNVYAKDAAENINPDKTVFTSDTTPPDINIRDPENITYFQKDIPAAVRLNEEGNSCKYSFEGGPNQSMVKEDSNNFSSTLNDVSYGFHDIKFWCEDIAGNVNDTDYRYFSNSQPQALYDSSLGAPFCKGGESPCEVLEELIISVNDIATNEPNSPNTIDSATDGSSGTYQSDESIDQINITDNDAPTFSSGHSVTVSTLAYCFGTSDQVNILFAEDVTNPSWTVENSQACSGSGFERFQTTFQLTGSGNVSVRALNEYNGGTGDTEVTSSYGDQDDVVIPLDNFAPEITLETPLNNTIIKRGEDLDLDVSDPKYGNLDSVTFVNGSGTNYSLSSPYIIDTSKWNGGTQEVVIWANDTAGNYANKTYQFDIDTGPPTVSNLLEKQGGEPVTRVFVGDNYEFSGEWSDDIELDYSNISSNLSGSFQNDSLTGGDQLSGAQDFANFTFQFPSTEFDVLGWKLWGKDKAGFFAGSSEQSIEIWERISLYWESPSGGNIVRGFTETFSCRLEKTRSGNTISNYQVNFYLNNSTMTEKLSTETTNINGKASYNWDSTNYALDDYTASCNVTADSSQQYALEKGEGNTTFTLERDNKPKWRNQKQAYDKRSYRRSNEIGAEGFDEEGLREAILATNESGVWDNKSVYGSPIGPDTSGTYTWTNFTWINQSAIGKTVGWKIWYRDSGGQYNSTDIKSFDVTEGDVTPPDIGVEFPDNTSYRKRDFNFSASANEQIKSWTYNIDGNTNTTVPLKQDYGLAFVNGSTSRLNILYTNGTFKDTSISPSSISGTGDVDEDKRNEFIYVDGSGNLKAYDRAGEIITLASGISTSKSPVAASSYGSDQTLVFYSDPNDNNYLKKVREGESPITVNGGIKAEGVLGSGDLDADGEKELVFIDSSTEVSYLDGGTVTSTGFSSFGTNNNYGLGAPEDFDNDGLDRVPFVDSSQNLGLLDRNGNTEIINSNYGSSAKSPVGGLDWSGDAGKEVVHVDGSGRLALQYLDGSTETLTVGGNNFQAVKENGVSSWRPYNPGRIANFSKTGLSDGYHQVNFWANDTNDNRGYGNLGFRVDFEEPRYRDLSDNVTDFIFQEQTASIDLQVRDDNSGIRNVSLATNETGTWENKTSYGSPILEPNISGSWILESFNWKNTTFNGILGYRAYVEDAAGNTNRTDKGNFNVTEAVTNFSAGEISFNRTDPVEGEILGVESNISRGELTPEDQIGVNITVETFDGVNWNVKNHKLETVSIPAGENISLGYDWNVEPGRYRFNYTVDPKHSLTEVDETDNKESREFNVTSYQVFYGGSDVKLELSSTDGDRMSAWLGQDQNSTLYFSDTDASYTFSDLSPLNVSGDLSEADQSLNLQGHNDSLDKIFDQSRNRCFRIGDKDLCDVPYINSTNTSSFQTGILYDKADGTGFDGSQDIIFATRVNSSKRGEYGVYDYEIKIPASLGGQKPSTDQVTVYSEIH